MKRLAVVVLAILVIMTVSKPAASTTFDSLPPRPLPMRYRFYVPMALNNYREPRVSPKKGIAATFTGLASDCKSVGCSWVYNWWTGNWTEGTAAGIEVVGFITHRFNRLHIPDSMTTPWVLVFNEPELASQDDLTAERAVPLWKAVEDRFPDRKLGSPANTVDEFWLDSFRDSYFAQFGRYPRFDAIAAHCYRPTAADCEAWVGKFIAKAKAWNVPEVWVTEFSFWDIGELEKFLAWMDGEPMIARYAYYSNRCQAETPQLFDCMTGSITPYGEVYKE